MSYKRNHLLTQVSCSSGWLLYIARDEVIFHLTLHLYLTKAGTKGMYCHLCFLSLCKTFLQILCAVSLCGHVHLCRCHWTPGELGTDSCDPPDEGSKCWPIGSSTLVVFICLFFSLCWKRNPRPQKILSKCSTTDPCSLSPRIVKWEKRLLSQINSVMKTKQET